MENIDYLWLLDQPRMTEVNRGVSACLPRCLVCRRVDPLSRRSRDQGAKVRLGDLIWFILDQDLSGIAFLISKALVPAEAIGVTPYFSGSRWV